ncbi:MAG TPA: GNAT family N-acetyltransferase [Pyrinomonadaceae bacterium]|nr:GNAT family N-acetyltransferase [Pyrinomonadaceae bacterium]
MNQAEPKHDIKIREVFGVKEFNRCIELQRAAFKLPDLEISPLRHFIVTNTCGGFTLGAFVEDELVGFVHHLIAVKNGEIIGYSHMAAISPDFQNAGIGARLKWAQREKALSQGVRFIKWTFEPMLPRNAHFNLNRLGATISSYAENYYGTDYNVNFEPSGKPIGLDSDRLFASWQLDSERVKSFERGASAEIKSDIAKIIEIPANWSELVKNDPLKAREEQLRVRAEFQTAFAENLICARFERGAETSRYLLYREI